MKEPGIKGVLVLRQSSSSDSPRPLCPDQMSQPGTLQNADLPSEPVAGETPTPVKISLDDRFNRAQQEFMEANKEKYRLSGRAGRKELVQATLEQFVAMLEQKEEVVDRTKRVAIKEVCFFSSLHQWYRTRLMSLALP